MEGSAREAGEAWGVEELQMHGMEGQVDGGMDARVGGGLREEVNNGAKGDCKRQNRSQNARRKERTEAVKLHPLPPLASPPCSLSHPVLSHPHCTMCSHLIFMSV